MRGLATNPMAKTSVEINNPARIAVAATEVTGEAKEVEEVKAEEVEETKTKIARGRSE